MGDNNEKLLVYTVNEVYMGLICEVEHLRLTRQSHAKDGQTLQDAWGSPIVDQVNPRAVDEATPRAHHDEYEDSEVK